jgi:predicted RecB family nuclease
VRRGDHEDRHSFWADSKEEERRIFEQMLAVIAEHPGARVYSYGSYERTFIKRMHEGARSKKSIDRVLSRLLTHPLISVGHKRIRRP